MKCKKVSLRNPSKRKLSTVFRTEHFSSCGTAHQVLFNCSARNIFCVCSRSILHLKNSHVVFRTEHWKVLTPASNSLLVFRTEHAACFAQEFTICTNSC